MNVHKTTFVNDLTAGQKVDEVFVLAEARQQQARNGPYWLLRLQDAQGVVEAKIWSPASREYAEFTPGALIRVQGKAGLYREQTQITVDRAEVLELQESEVDWSLFLPRSRRDTALMLNDLEELCEKTMQHQPWRSFCLDTLGDETVRARLLTAPGAKTLHHAYIGGLLEHTLAVCRLCLAMCDLYPDLDRETLLAAAVFHDLGKAWELSSGVHREYTDQGRLLGHILIGMEVLGPFLDRAEELAPELKLHFKHLLISHHGEYEFGSPRRPKTPEALALHYADNLDAKLNTVTRLLESLPEQENWTPYQRSMERQFYRTAHTPQEQPGPEPASGADPEPEPGPVPEPWSDPGPDPDPESKAFSGPMPQQNPDTAVKPARETGLAPLPESALPAPSEAEPKAAPEPSSKALPKSLPAQASESGAALEVNPGQEAEPRRTSVRKKNRRSGVGNFLEDLGTYE